MTASRIIATHRDGHRMNVNLLEGREASTLRLLSECGYIEFGRYLTADEVARIDQEAAELHEWFEQHYESGLNG